VLKRKKKEKFSFSPQPDTIRPICLPQYDYDIPGGTQCWISGWGYTQPDGGKTKMLLHCSKFYRCHKSNSNMVTECDNVIDRAAINASFLSQFTHLTL